MDGLFCPQSLVWGDIATWCAAGGTFAAAAVALWIALRDARQRKHELQMRGRLSVAKLYAPMGALDELLQQVEKAAPKVFEAMAGSAVAQSIAPMCALRICSDRLPGVISVFEITDAAYLPRDFGVALAATLGEVKLLTDILAVQSGRFFSAAEASDFGKMHEAAVMRTDAASIAKSARDNLAPFLAYGKNELGEKKNRS